MRPALTLPVSVIKPTALCVQTAAAVPWSMVRMLTTPAGKPDCCTALAISNAEVGVLLLGRTTTVLPAISAGAILRSKV
ncbi:hypothetical protein D3C87_2077070 [compost metagenome]